MFERVNEKLLRESGHKYVFFLTWFGNKAMEAFDNTKSLPLTHTPYLAPDPVSLAFDIRVIKKVGEGSPSLDHRRGQVDPSENWKPLKKKKKTDSLVVGESYPFVRYSC